MASLFISETFMNLKSSFQRLLIRKYATQLHRKTIKEKLKQNNPIISTEIKFRDGKYISIYPDVPDFENLNDKTIESFSRQMLIVKSRKEREKNKKLFLEGKHLIKHAVLAGLNIENIYFNHEETLTGLGLKKLKNVKIQRIPTKYLTLWSDLVAPTGIMAVCEKPELKKTLFPARQIPVTVICDNIKNHENLGSIVQCVAGAGCERLIATPSCIDIWDPKVLRFGYGSHFQFPLNNEIHWSSIRNFLPEVFTVILITGNDFPNTKLIFRRRRKGRNDQEFVDCVEKLNDGTIRETGFGNIDRLKDYSKAPLPLLNYSDIIIEENSHIVLIIGDDEEGLTLGAFKLAHENNGYKIIVPHHSKIELTSVSTTALTLFEICRKFFENNNKNYN